MLVDLYELLVRYLAAPALNLQAACVKYAERRHVQKLVQCSVVQ